MSHKGSCHCGRIAFEVDGEPGEVLSCNCSICRKKGSLLWFVPSAAFRLTTPPADVADYTFAQGRIHHRHCAHCGIHPYGEGTGPDGQAMVAVNVRCLDDLDPEALPVKHYDGRSL